MKTIIDCLKALVIFPGLPLLCVVLGECLTEAVSNSLPPCIQTPFMKGGAQ
ncbi:MAG: hypothetical protein IKY91_03965 [Akkermansia sp.]|nr:hypothetical protein [Akkermansia sp.]